MSDSVAVQRLLAMHKEGNLSSGEDLMSLSHATLEGAVDDLLLLSDDPRLDLDVLELGRLNWSPRKNWVENENGLPKYIEDVAIGIMKGSGYPRERAIPIAISRIKKWAAGLDGVKKDTQAKALAALAAWEKMKASAKAKRLVKK